MPRLRLTNCGLKLGAYIVISLIASGCSTSKDELLPHGDNTMMDVWDQGASGSGNSTSNRQLLDARQDLRRPLQPTQTGTLDDTGSS
jgi:conjugative transfer region lipoprotein (TIGR03751 family)